MDLKEIDNLDTDIDDHWYYNSKAQAMTRFLQRDTTNRILDVGAGSGFFSRYLLANTDAREAWCVDISYKADSDKNEEDKSIHYRRAVGEIDADLVLLMDVLEHVDDDLALLKDYVAKVPVGSRFLITVPAFNFLWSEHDDFLEHKRRYSLSHLEEVVKNADLSIRHSAYYFGMVFPIAATLRLAQKAKTKGGPARSQLTSHKPIVNTLLKSVCSLELPFMKFNRVAGLTVFCLAEKHKH